MDNKMNEENNMNDEVVMGLNRYLSNLGILFVKLHNYHWNVVGMGFYDLHEKTGEMYEKVSEMFDVVAERIRMFGYNPAASMQEYLKYGTIKEAPSEDINSTTISSILIRDYEKILKELRELNAILDPYDQNTVTILADGMSFFEKNIWMLSAYNKRL